MKLLNQQLQELGMSWEDIKKITGYFYTVVNGDIKTIIPPHILRKAYYKVPKLKKHSIDFIYDLCAICLNSLASTFYDSKKDGATEREELGYKRISSVILQNNLKICHVSYYKEIRQLLMDLDIIIQGDIGSKIKRKATEYKLADKLFENKPKRYYFKSLEVQKFWHKRTDNRIKKMFGNPIAESQLISLTLSEEHWPTDNRMKLILENKAKKGYINKNGQKLVIGGSNKSRYKGRKDVVLVEDYLLIYQYIKLLDITIGDEKSGGRVYTKYNMLPRIMREHIQFVVRKPVEMDYKTLHPNIMVSHFSNVEEHVTHSQVSEYLGISRKEAKLEHLSFFNKRINGMMNSPLWKYYKDKHPQMIDCILSDKQKNGHKNTSKYLFKTEVNLMKEIIQHLTELKINVLYVFDALYCQPKHVDKVREVMNQHAIKHNINTEV